MAVPLKTTPQIRALAPEPPATVRVQNLHLTLTHAGHDAWGRAGKSQPCTISVEVGFAERFSTAAASDRLGEDTVHYGTLSKVVLGSVARFEEGSRQHALGQGERGLMHVLEHVWRDLTGLKLDGTEVKVAGETPLIDIAKVQFLSLTVGLPKASLLGDGVALRASAVVDPSLRRVSARALALEITRLKVPTLIGVNANERLAKQFVVVTVTIEKFDQSEDIYPGVEAAVVKVSFGSYLDGERLWGC